MKRFSQRVLSRGKSDSKSSKKNKDSKDGTASPSGSSRETQSPVLTPTSSTSTLNDIRNKPLPPNNTTADHGSPGPQAAGQGNGDKAHYHPQWSLALAHLMSPRRAPLRRCLMI
ncbi:hypothetical protein PG990_002167 [Apiospora arundinis]